MRQGRIRVLQVGKFYPPYKGGMESHLETLCRELAGTADVRVLVASTDRRTHHETVDGVPVTRLGRLFHLRSASWTPGLARRIRHADADVVHLHLPNPPATLAYLASGHRGPLVVSYHSDIVRQRVLGPVLEPMLRRLLDRSSAIIVATPRHVESSSVLRPYRDRCRVIPYGIPAGAHAAPGAVAELRGRFGPRMVLAVGRLVYYKGFEFLIAAMKDVDARLVIVGDGPLRRPLEDAARAHGVADRVVFAGEVAELGPYYAAADVFVLPSVARSEAFGIVQIEAMEHGVPVVNTALDSGVPFVSLHDQTGLTVPPADAPALAAALNRILGDPELRARLGSAGRERARDEFSAAAMGARTLAVYRALLPAASARRAG